MFSVRANRPLLARLAMIFMLAVPAIAAATTVRMQTSLGPIDVALYDSAAPRTVANFLTYVNSGAYRNSFIHRSVPGFIIQGGGFAWNDTGGNVIGVATNAPIANEFSTSRSNRRGTIAMAKLGGDPNSATSQWFINLADNGFALDGQNGGFTVFGEVTAGSMAVVDAISRLPIVNTGDPSGAFGELPLVGIPANGLIQKVNLVIVSATTAVPNSYQGLWWNANESGWGMSLIQHGNIIFAAVYTYDSTGQPVWYVMASCPIATTSCSGDLYKVTGGTSPDVAWNGTAKVVTKVGTGALTFTGLAAGTFNYTINNIAGSKAITLQPLASGTTPPAIDYTDLWWNSNEDGWGIALTQQFGILFAAWYTYDATGKPVWYVATCPVTGAACTGDLYQVTGGAELTAVWKGTNPASRVGSVTFAFSNASTATMTYTLNNLTSSRIIARQLF
jgi:cyclophilin family peptidyl-prolyl cis-trans isomerase